MKSRISASDVFLPLDISSHVFCNINIHGIALHCDRDYENGTFMREMIFHKNIVSIMFVGSEPLLTAQ